jgi:hypothetical protein
MVNVDLLWTAFSEKYDIPGLLICALLPNISFFSYLLFSLDTVSQNLKVGVVSRNLTIISNIELEGIHLEFKLNC